MDCRGGPKVWLGKGLTQSRYPGSFLGLAPTKPSSGFRVLAVSPGLVFKILASGRLPQQNLLRIVFLPHFKGGIAQAGFRDSWPLPVFPHKSLLGGGGLRDLEEKRNIQMRDQGREQKTSAQSPMPMNNQTIDKNIPYTVIKQITINVCYVTLNQ